MFSELISSGAYESSQLSSFGNSESSEPRYSGTSEVIGAPIFRNFRGDRSSGILELQSHQDSDIPGIQCDWSSDLSGIHSHQSSDIPIRNLRNVRTRIFRDLGAIRSELPGFPRLQSSDIPGFLSCLNPSIPAAQSCRSSDLRIFSLTALFVLSKKTVRSEGGGRLRGSKDPLQPRSRLSAPPFSSSGAQSLSLS